jgi:type 4 prepilin peptidase
MLLTTVIVAVWIELTINIIPNELVILTLLLGLAYRVLSGWLRGDVLSSLLGSLGAFMITLVLFVCSIASARKASNGISHGVGAGAFKMALALSVAVGFPGVVFFYLGLFATVAVYFLFQLLTGSYSFLTEFPLSPFLFLGLLCGLACPYLLPAIWP